MNTKLSQKKFWNESYEKRKGASYPNLSRYMYHFELDRIFKRCLTAGNNKNLIELGCGASIWLPYFSKTFGYNVFGIDYSEKGCELAKFNLKKNGVEGEIICEDFLTKKVKELEGRFDIIVSMGVVEHFEDPEKIIRQLAVYLKTGGKIVTVVPNLKGVIGVIQKMVNEKVYAIHKVFGLDELVHYHRNGGINVTSSSYFDFMDLSMINMSNLSAKLQKNVLRTITLINFSILWLSKIFNISISNQKLCSYMVVVACKERGVENICAE